MEIIPAIDILDGKCVRLHQGDYSQKTEYNTDPIAVAQEWVKQGAKFLHLVDLNGAKEGKPIHLEIIGQIASTLSIPVELGGGIRNLKTIDLVISKGVSRVVLGTAAYETSDFVSEACRLFPDKIIVGIDGRDGKVAIKGWTETTELSIIELAKRLTDKGVKIFIYTDISRDGALVGPNLQGIKEFSKNTHVSVIASGGISKLEDIKNLINLGSSNIIGIIVGKALYDKRISLLDAIRLATK